MKIKFFLLLSFFFAVFIENSFAIDVVVYGPKKFERNKSGPIQQVDFFWLGGLAATGKIRIYNGGSDIDSSVSSGTVAMNDNIIIYQSDFNKNVKYIERATSLSSENKLTLELFGKPGSYLTISVIIDSECYFQLGSIRIDDIGFDLDKDGISDMSYVSKDFMENFGPFIATEYGSYCNGSGIGSGNRISPIYNIDFCKLESAHSFVPGSDNIGTYFTYQAPDKGNLFFVRSFNGAKYYKIEILDVNNLNLIFRWSEVNKPDCETCIPGEEGMNVCFKTIILEDDFEDDDTSDWKTFYSAIIEPSTTYPFEGGYSGRFINFPSGGCGYEGPGKFSPAYREFDPQSDIFIIEFDGMSDGQGGDYYWRAFGFSGKEPATDPLDNCNRRAYDTNEIGGVTYGRNYNFNTISCEHYSWSECPSTGSNFVPFVWNHFKLIVDVPIQEFTLFIDGLRIGTYPFSRTAYEIKYFLVSTEYCNLFIDNLKIYKTILP